MRKIKICYIIDSVNIGGANKLTVETAALLNKNIFDVSIISLEESNKIECDLPPGINLKFLNLKNYKRFKKVRILAKNLSGFDIIHPVLENAMLFTSLAKLFYLRKSCLITTIHGLDTPTMIDDTQLNEFIKKNWNVKYFFISKHLLRHLYKLYNKILAVSNNTGAYLFNKRSVPVRKIINIYHGINISKFLEINEVEKAIEIRKRFGFEPNDFIIGYIGRLTYAKGLEYLIDQMKPLNEWNKNIKFLFVGEGEIKSLLFRKIKEKNLESICKMNELVANVKDYYNTLNLFILPSFSEGIPLSLLESMLMKRVTLSSDVGGIPEVIEDNVNGFLFNKGNFVQMSEKIKFIYDSKDDLKKITENAYNTVLEKFDLNKNVRDIETIFINENEKNK